MRNYLDELLNEVASELDIEMDKPLEVPESLVNDWIAEIRDNVIKINRDETIREEDKIEYISNFYNDIYEQFRDDLATRKIKRGERMLHLESKHVQGKPRTLSVVRTIFK